MASCDSEFCLMRYNGNFVSVVEPLPKANRNTCTCNSKKELLDTCMRKIFSLVNSRVYFINNSKHESAT